MLHLVNIELFSKYLVPKVLYPKLGSPPALGLKHASGVSGTDNIRA